MRGKILVLGLLAFFFCFAPAFAAGVSISQSGSDAGSIIEGRVFTITVSGLSGSGTVNLIDTPSGFSSEEGTSKSFSESVSSVTWTTAKISQIQSSIKLRASISVQGSPTIAESESFDVVLPPSISFEVTPSSVEVDEDSAYTVTLNARNLGGTSAQSVAFSVSGTGMSASCPSIALIALGASSSTQCEVTASQAGTITATFTASPSNSDEKTDSVAVVVSAVGGGDDSRDNGPGGGSTGGGGGGAVPSAFWNNTYSVPEADFAAGSSRLLSAKERIKLQMGSEYHYVGIISLSSNSATINVSSTPQQATLFIGEEKMFEVNNDSYYDLKVRLNSVSGGKANITVTKVNLPVPKDNVVPNNKSTQPVAGPEDIKSTPDICSSGLLRCFGSELQECVGNAWQTIELCNNGCDGQKLSCRAAIETTGGQAEQGSGVMFWALIGVIILAIGVIIYKLTKKHEVPQIGFTLKK